MRNADIFDEEELLAIANDGSESDDDDDDDDDSASSSSSSFSHGNEKEEVVSDAKNVGEHPSDHESNIHCTSLAHQSSSHDMNDTNDDDDNDDDNDDAGFLESWLLEAGNPNTKEPEVSSNMAQSRTIDVVGSDNENDDRFETKTEEIIDNNETTKRTRTIFSAPTELKLGRSILDCFSRKNAMDSKTHTDQPSQDDSNSTTSLVAIERKYSMQQGGSITEGSTAQLRLISHSKKKRSQHHGEGSTSMLYNVETATLEETTDHHLSNREMKYTVQSKTRNRTVSAISDETMVDCLAIFDHHRRCYVLEIVDCIVTNLTPSTQGGLGETISCRKEGTITRDEDDSKQRHILPTQSSGQMINENKSAAQVIAVDPLSAAKRADHQVVSLKRRRGGK